MHHFIFVCSWFNALSVNPVFIAIDTSGRLTDAGLKIAEFPVEPIMGKMLLSSKDFKVTFNEMQWNWVIMLHI